MNAEKLTIEMVMKYYKSKVICYGEKILYDIHFIDVKNERLYLRTGVFDVGDIGAEKIISTSKLRHYRKGG